MLDLNWGTKSKTRSLASRLNWAVGESGTPTPDEIEPDVLTPDVVYPDTLVDDPKDSDDAIDHSDGTKAHDALATNWDALLDTAGIPTDGTPPDPLAAQQEQQAREEEAARRAQSLDTGFPQPGRTPSAPSAPSAPLQDKANQKQRAGRGIEGCGDDDASMGPTNPMDPSSKYNWDQFSSTPGI
jgi:hypothetical protein